jgi:RimJ/RimL family protein N-acetyltransferase
MNLHPTTPKTEELIGSWLSTKENYQWLDFGGMSQALSAVSIRLMNQSNKHYLRVFTPDEADLPIGLAALSDIHRDFRTARLWYVLGDKQHAGKGYATRAVSALLKLGFGELGLKSISAWAVEANKPSVAVLRKNRFREIGNQRQCHYIDGRCHDRLLFDLLASEFGGQQWD